MAEQFFLLRAPTHERGQQDTYIYERIRDGFIFECNAKEAAQKEKVPTLYKQVGFSNGAAFYDSLRKLVKTQDDALEKIGGIEPDIRTDAWKIARKQISRDTEKAYKKLMADTRKKAMGKFNKPYNNDLEIIGNQSLASVGLVQKMLRR